MEMMGFHTVF